jgi:hypothetical protein
MKPVTSKKRKQTIKGIDAAILRLGIHITATSNIPPAKTRD